MKREKFKPFACDACGAQVVLKTGKDRIMFYDLCVPDDYELATCVKCGETYASLEEAKELDDIRSRELLNQGLDLAKAIKRESSLMKKIDPSDAVTRVK